MTIEGSAAAGAGRRLRLGMVGGGQGAFIGAVHRIAARLDDRWELVAGSFASDPARSKASAAALHVAPERAYGDYREMALAEAARAEGIDAVAVVTPNHLHHAVAKAFLEAGIHVICDKPLTTTLDEAVDLVRMTRASGRVFGVTYNYSGLPLVRQMREMVAAGELGPIRLVEMRYLQDWLTTPLEASGQKQAAWRTDPARSGPAGCLGDIGTHAYHLGCFVTGLAASELCAELISFVPGRRLDDDARVLLRYPGGARGLLRASQVAPGNENGLSLEVYGEKGGLSWRQEEPNSLRFAPYGEPPRLLTRAGPGTGPAAAHASRVPAGHPEGYLEGFSQLYSDLAEQVAAALEGRSPDPAALLVPGVEEGARGVAFVAACLESSRAGGAWTAVPPGL